MKLLCDYTQSTVGKKTVVAVTGFILIGFLFFHLLGNLQMFAGAGETPELTKMNEYAAFLKKEPALLWVARLGLLVVAFSHIFFTISLTRHNKKARPIGYVNKKTYSTLQSRTMIYGGLFLFFYIIYHLMHFTLGIVHQDLLHGHDVYRSVVDSFQQPLISLVYILAMFFLFFHLLHGVQSLFQTLGMTNPSHIKFAKQLGTLIALVICGGFISIVVGVWVGWIV